MIQYFPEAANRANTCTHVMGLLSWYKRQVALLVLIWGYDSSQLFTRHRLDFTSITAAENITVNSIVIKLSADWVSHLSLLYSLSVSVVNNMQIYKISKASRWANESVLLPDSMPIYSPTVRTPGNFVDGWRRRRHSVGKYFDARWEHY